MKSKAYASSPDASQAKTKDRPKIAGVCAVVCGRLVKFAQLAYVGGMVKKSKRITSR